MGCQKMLLIAVFTSAVISLANAQCNLPADWQNIYLYQGYTARNILQLAGFNDTTFNDLSSSAISKCEGQALVNGYTVVSFTLVSTEIIQKRYCFEGKMNGAVMFYRKTAEVPRDAAFTIDECQTFLTQPENRNVLKIYVVYPFALGTWNTPGGPPDGMYGFSYVDADVITGTADPCVDSTATVVVNNNVCTMTSTCITGDQSYTNPFAGAVYIVSSLTDSELSVGGSTTSGFVVLAMETLSGSVGGVDYRFYVARYMTDSSTKPGKLNIGFVTANPNDPTGYLTTDAVPAVDENSILVMSLTSDECEAITCMNGGSCLQEWLAGSCSCASGYEGADCSTNIQECALTVEPCANGGICTDAINGFTCQCATGFSGKTCDLEDKCVTDPCKNGASCYTSQTGYVCVCATGFFGQICDMRDECVINSPCENGATCFWNGNEFLCQCAPGYTGDTCSDMTSGSCENVECQNDGECVVTENSYYCQCPTFFDGDLCQDMSDWFIVALVLMILLTVILIILLIVCCCYCCCGWRPDNNYQTMQNSSESSLYKEAELSPGTIQFNVSPASPYYGIQVIDKL